MNIRKFIAIVAAIVINCAVLAWINSVGVRAVADAAPPGASTPVVTLPTITVRPTRTQLDALRDGSAPRVKPTDSV